MTVAPLHNLQMQFCLSDREMTNCEVHRQSMSSHLFFGQILTCHLFVRWFKKKRLWCLSCRSFCNLHMKSCTTDLLFKVHTCLESDGPLTIKIQPQSKKKLECCVWLEWKVDAVIYKSHRSSFTRKKTNQNDQVKHYRFM